MKSILDLKHKLSNTTTYTFINLEHSQPRCLGLMLLQDEVKHLSLTPFRVDTSILDWYISSQELHSIGIIRHEIVTKIGTEPLPRIISEFQ